MIDIIDKYKPTKFFINNNMTQLSERHLRRKCAEMYNGDDENIIKRKNKNNRDLWLINLDSIGIIGKRRRKEKKKKENNFKIEITVNFNDNLDVDYYLKLVKLFNESTNCNIMYKIERDKNNKNHLHMAVDNDDKCLITNEMKKIITHDLQRSISSGIKKHLLVNEIIDEKKYYDYISKGYDGLGGDFPSYILD